MKNIRKTLAFVAVGAAIALGSYSFTPSKKGGFIKIYLENKCSSDVTVYITQSGGGSKYTIDDKTSKSFSLQDGQKVYDENQKELIAEITSSSEGKTYIVCD
jgi:uncharacterized membrane-anchored protein YitT (DUF2179 family)